LGDCLIDLYPQNSIELFCGCTRKVFLHKKSGALAGEERITKGVPTNIYAFQRHRVHILAGVATKEKKEKVEF